MAVQQKVARQNSVMVRLRAKIDDTQARRPSMECTLTLFMIQKPRGAKQESREHELEVGLLPIVRNQGSNNKTASGEGRDCSL